MSIKKCTKCKEEKPLEEYSKRSSAKDGRQACCKQCTSRKNAKHYADNRDKIITNAVAYAKVNKVKVREYKTKWRRANPEAQKLAMKNSWKKKPEKYKAMRSTAKARSRAAKLERSVVWADQSAIQDIYARAQALSVATGVQMHVDHIIPMRGELVCGLHVENNLQILPATVNMSKNNKFKVE